VPLPHVTTLDVVDVRDFTLVDHDLAKLLITQELLKVLNLVAKLRADVLIAGIVYSCIPRFEKRIFCLAARQTSVGSGAECPRPRRWAKNQMG